MGLTASKCFLSLPLIFGVAFSQDPIQGMGATFPKPLYDEWIQAGLNNAHLASVATYFDCVPAFERLLTEVGGSLPDFYERVRALARHDTQQDRVRLCAPHGIDSK